LAATAALVAEMLVVFELIADALALMAEVLVLMLVAFAAIAES